MRVAALVRHGTDLTWGLVGDWDRPGAYPPPRAANWAESGDAVVEFSPELVHVLVGLASAAIDPPFPARPSARVRVRLPALVWAGTVVSACTVEGHDIEVGLLALGATDVESRRCGRWRVRPRIAHAVPAELRELDSGHRRGSMTLAEPHLPGLGEVHRRGRS